jgi:hypothetical protein
MKLFFPLALALCGAGAVAALLSPWLVMRRAAADADAPLRALARRYLALSAFIVAVTGGGALHLSFTVAICNVLVILAAIIGSAMLVIFSFRIRPAWLGISSGIFSACGWLMGCLFFALGALFEGNSPADVELGNGLHCRATVYGFAAGDSGEEFDIYRRFLLIDYRIYYERHSDVYPINPVPAPPDLREAIPRCRVLVNRQRQAGGTR